MSPDPRLADLLERHGQGHLLRWWPVLAEPEREELAREVASLDLDRLDDLIRRLVLGHEAAAPDAAEVRPVAVSRLPRTDAERVTRRHMAEVGEAMLAAGEVAVVVVAGGQGTRLGFDGPKGTYPIGPVSGASLFQIHCEKILALSRRHGRSIPLYVMTSPENHEATANFLAEHSNFGLDRVRLFTQGQMPAVDKETGKILLADKAHLALSPDGHGGTLTALAAAGPGGSPSCLEEMRSAGIRTIFYFQVDNPLVQIADPAFLGLHRKADAEVSFKVVEKVMPDERVGVVVEVDGRPQVIEYSDLPPELAERREPDGRLELWAGSVAIHIFERAFIERIVSGSELPFHRAIKKVAFVDETGAHVEPAAPNAVKFETFIFDALPLADRYAVVECDRSIEFEPLKNAQGPDSPASVRQRMSDNFAGWLEGAGATVTRNADGSTPFGIEISPLFALDAAELKGKVPAGLVVDGPTYLPLKEPVGLPRRDRGRYELDHGDPPLQGRRRLGVRRPEGRARAGALRLGRGSGDRSPGRALTRRRTWLHASLLGPAFPRPPGRLRMAPRGDGRELVLQPVARVGRVALPGPVQVLRECPEQDLRPGQAVRPPSFGRPP